ncbi:MAG: tail fiber domain-containing protein, partial [Robiginitomaculum sp.]|nr:tail fiber domain-containing protein [Robiginitomaculum sp.]
GPWTTITAAAQFPDFEADGVLFFIQGTAPVNPQVGWIWANSADNFKQYKWSGTAWDLWFDPNAKLDKVPSSLAPPIATSLTSQAITRRAGAGLDKNGVPITGAVTGIDNKISFNPPASTEVHALALELEVTLADLTTQSFFAPAGAPSIKDTVDVTSQSNSSLNSARARFVGAGGVNSPWVSLTISNLSGITSQADGPGLSIQGDVSVEGGVPGETLVYQGSWWKTTKYSYTNLINIPTTFTPAAHTHGFADVPGLQGALDGKLNLTGGTLTGSLTIDTTFTSPFILKKTTVAKYRIGIGSSDFWFVGDLISGTIPLRMDKAAPTGTFTLLANGNISTVGTLSQGSDRRHKKNIAGLSGCLAKIRRLEPKIYEHTITGATDLGLIAQDVKKVFPEVVDYDRSRRRYGIQYTGLIAPIIAAVQELADRIEEK